MANNANVTADQLELVSAVKHHFGASTTELSSWMAYDAIYRSEEAANAHPEVFDSLEHRRKVADLVKFAKEFYVSYNRIYINARFGYKRKDPKPFTAVKLTNAVFPYLANAAQRENKYLAPLRKLGVDLPTLETRTNSIIFHVYST